MDKDEVLTIIENREDRFISRIEESMKANNEALVQKFENAVLKNNEVFHIRQSEAERSIDKVKIEQKATDAKCAKIFKILDALSPAVERLTTEQAEDNKKLTDFEIRMRKVERYMYMIMGALALVTTIMGTAITLMKQ